ncbi:hypothetical protein EDB80DRAFT_729089 [Ilyonectria destructans]|nr:hypothetical protein EDB80DRAFT_729089 [Ilyonectria destructans]
MDEITFNKEMDMMMSFSYGPRICIGKNLALSEIRHFLCLLLLSYTSITPASETTIDSMEEYEAGLTVPKSGKCVLTFQEGLQA